MRRLVLLLALVGASSGCIVWSQAKQLGEPPAPRELHDLPYRTGEAADPAKHALDLYVPDGPGPHPVLVFVHGGGWRVGDRTWGTYEATGRRFAARGFLTVIVSYRIAPEHRHPALVEDVAASIAWVLEHAHEHGGDPRRIVLSGQSAGAHLALLATSDPRWLAAHGHLARELAGIVAISGPYELVEMGRSRVLVGKPLVEPAFGPDEAVWRAASPARWAGVTPLPPVLFGWADSDPEILQRQGEETAKLYASRGVVVTTTIARFKDHLTSVMDLGEAGDPLSDEIERFVRSVPAAPR